MIKSVLSVIIIVSPPVSEEQLQGQGNAALHARDYKRAAATWERLARRDPLTLHRAGVIYAAVTAWALDYKAHRRASSLCAGVGLLQWYFTRSTVFEPELVDLYRDQAATKQRDGITCKLRPVKTSRPVAEKPQIAQTNRDSPVSPQTARLPEPTQHLTITGALLTSVGLGGLAGMTGALVGHAKYKRKLLDIGAHGPEAETVYHQGKLLEHWAIAAGLTGGISLVTGVALLAVAGRRQRLTVTPQLGGLTIHGRF